MGELQPKSLCASIYLNSGRFFGMPQVDKRAFGQRVTRRREAMGMTQGTLAEMIGMRQQGIGNIEQGVVARPRLMRELATALRTTEAWLLWRQGPPDADPEPGEITQVRLISWVSAGHLADAESQTPFDDAPLLTFADLGPGDFFALKVIGDSMDRLSPDGSIIVVNRAERDLTPDKPYVFWHRTEGATFKLWQNEPARLEPASWNAANKPIYIKRKSEFDIIGRVRRTVLDL